MCKLLYKHLYNISIKPFINFLLAHSEKYLTIKKIVKLIFHTYNKIYICMYERDKYVYLVYIYIYFCIYI